MELNLSSIGNTSAQLRAQSEPLAQKRIFTHSRCHLRAVIKGIGCGAVVDALFYERGQ